MLPLVHFSVNVNLGQTYVTKHARMKSLVQRSTTRSGYKAGLANKTASHYVKRLNGIQIYSNENKLIRVFIGRYSKLGRYSTWFNEVT